VFDAIKLHEGMLVGNLSPVQNLNLLKMFKIDRKNWKTIGRLPSQTLTKLTIRNSHVDSEGTCMQIFWIFEPS
jgi:hypothetical protein